jgi:uncharacterized protein YbjT (DUF2867 family)
MILVTGATGVVGSQIVRALTARGAPVRAFVRDAERARALLGEGVELAPGDLTDAASVRAALRGIDAMLLSCADDPRRVAWESAAIDAAAAAGVHRVVKLSSVVARPGAPVAFWDWHGRVECHLRASGLPAVVVRASFFDSNVLAAAEPVAREGVLPAPAGGARIAMIDPRDVGAAAAAVLCEEEHERRTYVLTGPEAIGYERVAADLSAVTGRDVRFVDVPDAVAIQQLVASGASELVARAVVGVFAQARRGAAERVTGDVAALTGRRPRDFGTYSRDHAHLFAPAAAEVAR